MTWLSKPNLTATKGQSSIVNVWFGYKEADNRQMLQPAKISEVNHVHEQVKQSNELWLKWILCVLSFFTPDKKEKKTFSCERNFVQKRKLSRDGIVLVS